MTAFLDDHWVMHRHVSRWAMSAASLIVLGGGFLGSAGGASAAPAATGVAPPGGGYVANPTTVHAARLTLVVPTVRCAKGRSGRVDVGMFGTIRSGSTLSRWKLSVVVSCHGRTASYRGVHSDQSGRITVLRVHAGDRVRLLQSGASEYEIDDFSTHAAAGGGSAAGPGAEPVLTSPVLFGAQVNGSVAHSLRVQVLRARLNRTPLDSVPHHRQRQTSNGRAVARGRGLGEDGSFTVAVAAATGVRNVPAPVITGLSSHSGSVAGDDTMTIRGRYLADLSYVQFGSARCRAYYDVSDSTVVIGVPDHAGVGTVDVRVRTEQGLSAVTPADRYTYAP